MFVPMQKVGDFAIILLDFIKTEKPLYPQSEIIDYFAHYSGLAGECVPRNTFELMTKFYPHGCLKVGGDGKHSRVIHGP
jgi:hypothetical protein